MTEQGGGFGERWGAWGCWGDWGNCHLMPFDAIQCYRKKKLLPCLRGGGRRPEGSVGECSLMMTLGLPTLIHLDKSFALGAPSLRECEIVAE